MRTILLTGDSRGVGLEIAKIILDTNEYHLVGISRSQSLESKELQRKYKNYTHIDFDLKRVNDIKELYQNRLKKLGPYIGFVNNAAIAYDDIITNLSIDRLEDMYRVNVFAPMQLCKYMIRDMLLHKTKGSIVHISSISTQTGYKGLAMYGSTKGAIEAFSKNTSREWGTIAIRSNVVRPGFMETDMSASLDDTQRTKILNRNSLKEKINIKSVAQTVEFLLSDKSQSITGQIINTDNGTI